MIGYSRQSFVYSRAGDGLAYSPGTYEIANRSPSWAISQTCLQEVSMTCGIVHYHNYLSLETVNRRLNHMALSFLSASFWASGDTFGLCMALQEHRSANMPGQAHRHRLTPSDHLRHYQGSFPQGQSPDRGASSQLQPEPRWSCWGCGQRW